MTDDKRGRRRTRKILWLALAAGIVLLAAAIVPPLVSVSRYKGQITHLISASVGRPVRLSSVEARLLPRPGFVLTDLTVDEDPEYGAEPVLHANTVTASIRLLSLWRGRLEIGRISVDEASVNLVRTANGHWNVGPIFRTAAAQSNLAGGAARPSPLKLPYLEATNSRINLKNGVEKLPFSLVSADLSFWQDEPGDWRIRLRGQPARTDLSLDLADTGIMRLEGSVRHAAELRQMPLRLDLEWREAQLGQLTRLIIGSDPGWRGDLTGELHLDGTAESAQIKARLRAESVHRAEFAPAAPMDFDANCGFVYRFFSRSVENLACDSPLGNGRVHLTGEMPASPAPPRLSVELDRIPVQVGLDALRTVRSGFGEGLEASGTVSGKISYAEAAPESATAANSGAKNRRKAALPVPSPLTGSFTVDGFQLRGGKLTTPIQAPKVVLAPVNAPQGQPQALAAIVAIPAGGSSPLSIFARLSTSGYQLTVRGQAAISRARELALVAGMADASDLDAVGGDPMSVDLDAEGSWLPAPQAFVAGISTPGAVPTVDPSADMPSDRLSGTLTLRKAEWKADFLANPVSISQATLHLGDGAMHWNPVEFSYGPVKGTATLNLPLSCKSPLPCAARPLPSFTVEFGQLDAASLQSAFLGARKPGTLLSTLLARLRPSSSAPSWPRFEGTVKASALILGPIKLQNAAANLHIVEDGAEISSFDAGLLGGTIHASGTFQAAGTEKSKPSYSLSGQFQKLNPTAVGQLLGLRWSGGTFDGGGKIDLAGFTGHDLASSARGSVHFEWKHGSVAGPVASVPAALVRFDRWTAAVDIGNGAITLKDNQVQKGIHNRSVEGAATLGEPPKVALTAPKEIRAKR